MSYASSYRLDWPGEPPDLDQVARVLAMVEAQRLQGRLAVTATDEGSLREAAGWWREVILGEPCSWETWKQDMCAVSGLWPEVLFQLTIEGEDSDDRWRDYYLGGRVQPVEGEIVYGAFNPARLTEPGALDCLRGWPGFAGFMHGGVLACRDTGGYWLVPVAPPAPVCATTLLRPSKAYVAAVVPERVMEYIDRLLDYPPEFQLTEANLREEAEAHVVAAIQHVMDNLHPGLVYSEMGDIPAAVPAVAGYIQELLDLIKKNEVKNKDPQS